MSTSFNKVLAGFLLLMHAGLLTYSASVHSPTFNEPSHLVAGIRILQTGRFDLYAVNPPLVKTLAAIPLALAEAKTEWKNLVTGPGVRCELAVGEDFVAANGPHSVWLMALARYICIPFSLLGALVCYLWAKALFGEGAGLISLCLWCFCPNILGHGCLITPDVAAASLCAAAAYAHWRWLDRPCWRNAAIGGVVLGIAELSKTTLLVCFGIWPLVWLLYRLPVRQSMSLRRWCLESTMLIGSLAMALYIINAGYFFDGSMTRLGDFEFASRFLGWPHGGELGSGNRFSGTFLESIPVPFPRDYVLGIDLQKRDFEAYGEPSYLRGTFGEEGWWYYYLYALAIKVPLGTWLVAAVLSVNCDRSQTSRSRYGSRFVFSMAALLVLFVSLQSGFSEHMRYALPAFPFAFIWLSQAARFPPYTLRQVACVGAIGWSAVSSMCCFPHSLSYFNELAGGPLGGPRHLLHSNIDWGQDLSYLSEWLAMHPEVGRVHLAYFGSFAPEDVGVEYLPVDPLDLQQSAPRPGWYAVSANLVYGLPSPVCQGNGTKQYLRKGALAYFKDLPLTATAGYSIYLYEIPPTRFPAAAANARQQ